MIAESRSRISHVKQLHGIRIASNAPSGAYGTHQLCLAGPIVSSQQRTWRSFTQSSTSITTPAISDNSKVTPGGGTPRQTCGSRQQTKRQPTITHWTLRQDPQIRRSGVRTELPHSNAAHQQRKRRRSCRNRDAFHHYFRMPNWAIIAT